MLAEAMAGISLVKASVEFIKSNIDTAKDIGEIAGAVDGLFRGHDELQKERSKKAGMGVGDQFGIKNVAQEVIDARIAAEQMQEMKNMINMRFGPDTWKSIVDERARRIQEARELEENVRREKVKKAKEDWETIKQLMVGGAVVIVILTAIVGTVLLAK